MIFYYYLLGTADSLFRLKSEREWDDDVTSGSGQQQQPFSNELFALDLKLLEAAVGTVPIHKQLGMEDHEIDVRLRSEKENRTVIKRSYFFPV